MQRPVLFLTALVVALALGPVSGSMFGEDTADLQIFEDDHLGEVVDAAFADAAAQGDAMEHELNDTDISDLENPVADVEETHDLATASAPTAPADIEDRTHNDAALWQKQQNAGTMQDFMLKPGEGMTPDVSSVLGDTPVFFDVEEPHMEAASCVFGTTRVNAEYSHSTGKVMCIAPAAEHAGPVAVQLQLGDRTYHSQIHYATQPTGGARIAVNTDALLKNVAGVRQKIPSHIKLCAVVKDQNPVGELARAIEGVNGVDYLGVATLQEAMHVRRAGTKKPLMLMYCHPPELAPMLLHNNIEPSALSINWVQTADKLLHGAKKKLRVHMWVDTGMGREGVVPEDAVPLARAIEQSANLELAGVATHFMATGFSTSNIEKFNGGLTEMQINNFRRVTDQLQSQGLAKNAVFHAGASGTLSHEIYSGYFDMLRIGRMLFTDPPNAAEHMYTFKTHVSQVKVLPKGHCLGYGCHKRTDKFTKVAILPNLDADVRAFVHGERVHCLVCDGFISLLDVTHVQHEVKEGDPVVLRLRQSDNSQSLFSDEQVPVSLE